MKYVILKDGVQQTPVLTYTRDAAERRLRALVGKNVSLSETLTGAVKIADVELCPVREDATAQAEAWQVLRPEPLDVSVRPLVEVLAPVDLPAETYAQKLLNRCSELHEIYENGDEAWVRYDGYAFKTDTEARTNLSSVLPGFQTGIATEVSWTGRSIPTPLEGMDGFTAFSAGDRISYTITGQDAFMAFYTVIVMNMQNVRAKRAEAEAAIAACYVEDAYDYDALKAVDVESYFLALHAE